MITIVTTWVGVAAGLAVLVLMAVSDHMNDKAQPEGRVAPKQARRTLHRSATATVVRKHRVLPSRFGRVHRAA
ncbi:hypothetical protein [Allokutzneria albata]|uniref:Uncharacterized protein n=1 Tax=Allokutzneria albata TaxID=211114 RepID=A0A1G9RXN4_ALLAB|nr:hypothetical protein [Allokutzneria albata]SDM27924.1 hypothetical protein SAMN04489726_0756 [Allokutzneria albata]